MTLFFRHSTVHNLPLVLYSSYKNKDASAGFRANNLQEEKKGGGGGGGEEDLRNPTRHPSR